MFAFQANFLSYYCFLLIYFVSLVVFILSEIDGHLIQGRRIKNHYPVKVLINIFHPTQLLAFLDSYFL
jgi:hypothetical protein